MAVEAKRLSYCYRIKMHYKFRRGRAQRHDDTRQSVVRTDSRRRRWGYYHGAVRHQPMQRRNAQMKSGRRSGHPPPYPTLRAGKGRADQRDAAHELAIAALGFIARNRDELSRFLALTGIDHGSIRTAAEEPRFLDGVLAYIAGNEHTLLAFAAQAGVAPEEIEKARFILTGADWERDLP
jgi:hypothetical protein